MSAENKDQRYDIEDGSNRFNVAFAFFNDFVSSPLTSFTVKDKVAYHPSEGLGHREGPIEVRLEGIDWKDARVGMKFKGYWVQPDGPDIPVYGYYNLQTRKGWICFGSLG